ncbi:hypothetical protein KIPB_016728, partial [Kipferlia bialata]|eukprot:g16728.t1
MPYLLSCRMCDTSYGAEVEYVQTGVFASLAGGETQVRVREADPGSERDVGAEHSTGSTVAGGIDSIAYRDTNPAHAPYGGDGHPDESHLTPPCCEDDVVAMDGRLFLISRSWSSDHPAHTVHIMDLDT